MSAGADRFRMSWHIFIMKAGTSKSAFFAWFMNTTGGIVEREILLRNTVTIEGYGTFRIVSEDVAKTADKPLRISIHGAVYYGIAA